MIIKQGATLSQKQQTLEKRVSERRNLLVGNTRYPETRYLALDAERRMVGAVRFASHIRSPITTMLTINAAHLQKVDSDSVFHIGHLWDGYRNLLELLRKWITGRGVTWSCIWVREYTGGKNEHHGEHWHIALHLPPRLQSHDRSPAHGTLVSAKKTRANISERQRQKRGPATVGKLKTICGRRGITAAKVRYKASVSAYPTPSTTRRNGGTAGNDARKLTAALTARLRTKRQGNPA
jgi:hypothetical protein